MDFENADWINWFDSYSGEFTALGCFVFGFIIFTSYNRINKREVLAPELLDYDKLILKSIGEGKLEKALGLFDE